MKADLRLDNLDNKDPNEKRTEHVCYNCSTLFFSDDEEAMYCQKCWDLLLKDFFKSIKKDRFDI